MKSKIIEGNLVDVKHGLIYPARIIYNKKIISIMRLKKKCKQFIVPGLIDSHIHIESTMLTPQRFSETVIPHGTVATVSDPHEIANVSGLKGIKFMIDSIPEKIKINYTAPSCVPTTSFETSGAKINAKDISALLKMKRVVALGEMMNYLGVINKDKEVMEKIAVAKRLRKKIDGHCPMLKGSELVKYVSAGITTEHEATNRKEGLEKLMNAMKLMIRNGSSEKNMEELIHLAKTHPDDCFLVSDDRNPIDLKKGHVDSLIREAIKYGLDPITAIKCCTINPAKYYGLNTGIIETGKSADFVVVKNLRKFEVKEVYIVGDLVAKDGKCLIKIKQSKFPLCIKSYRLKKGDFRIKSNFKKVNARVIKVVKNQIYTRSETSKLKVKNGIIQPDKRKKICYLAVVNRYKKAKPSLCFVKEFYVNGAIASSISHDSHNIIVVGNNPEDMLRAVSIVMKNGGIAFVKGKEKENIPLEVAGLMTNASVDEVATKLKKIHKRIRRSGCKLKSPSMQLSFLSLLVIPELKLSDKGLFDSKNSKFVDLFDKF